MHMGRSHHSAMEVVGSAIGGFGISFLVLTSQVILQSSKDFQAQLLAGDPSANRELPTTLNAMRSVADGDNAIMLAMSSYVWWTMVIVVGIIASFALMKIMRKYV